MRNAIFALIDIGDHLPCPCAVQDDEVVSGSNYVTLLRENRDHMPPGETVNISISYIEPLQYEACEYEFVFPMDDMEIVAEVQKHPEARVFGFGIGSSVNRFLLDRMSLEGRGEVEYVALNDDANAAVKRFEQRIREPLLTDISIDWGGLPVADVYPVRIPDLFAAKPILVTGRFTGPARGTVQVRGRSGGKDTVRDVAVNLPASEPGHDVLATLWARRRVADLLRRDYTGRSLEKEITQIGLDFGIMTHHTSFVAIETTSDGGRSGP